MASKFKKSAKSTASSAKVPPLRHFDKLGPAGDIAAKKLTELAQNIGAQTQCQTGDGIGPANLAGRPRRILQGARRRQKGVRYPGQKAPKSRKHPPRRRSHHRTAKAQAAKTFEGPPASWTSSSKCSRPACMPR